MDNGSVPELRFTVEEAIWKSQFFAAMSKRDMEQDIRAALTSLQPSQIETCVTLFVEFVVGSYDEGMREGWEACMQALGYDA